MRNEKDEAKRTQVDDITSKVGHEPRLVKPESTNVKGVAAIVHRRRSWEPNRQDLCFGAQYRSTDC